MSNIKKILMERDGLTEKEAQAKIIGIMMKASGNPFSAMDEVEKILDKSE